MPQESRHAWFVRRLLADAAVIGTLTWLALFVMELIKPGIVSFYLPLSQALFLLLAVGLIALSMQPAQMSEPYSKQNITVLGILSAVSALVIYKTTEVEWWLTLLLILVTVGAIWASAALFSKS